MSELSTERLIKRKKFAMFIIGICIGVAMVSLGIAFYQILQGEKSSAIVPGIAGMVVAMIPMAAGVKKINKELERRGDV